MLTQEKLKELLHYNPDTGLFTWLVNRGKARTGATAGSDHRYYRNGESVPSGYIAIRVCNKTLLAHRLAWLYMTGKHPNEIDHINHNKSDNRWSNLRNVSNAENSKNVTLRSDNSSGVMGISRETRRGTWRVRINNNGKELHLGEFHKFEDAVMARKTAEKQFNYHTNHGKKKGA